MTPSTAAFLSGLAWGVLGAVAFGGGGWGWESPRLATGAAVGTGTAVGVLVYLSSRWAYRLRLPARLSWSAVTLYTAVAVTGAAAGVAGTGVVSAEALAVGLVACSVLTVFAPFWVLFGLAFLNHEWLRAVYLDSLDPDPGAHAV